MIIDVKAQQDHQLETSPFYINKQEIFYAQLKYLFEADCGIGFRFDDAETVRVLTLAQRPDLIGPYSVQMIGNTCPILENTLEHLFETAEKSFVLGVVLRNLWRHCESPGVVIASNELKTVYMKELLEVNNYLPENKSLVCTVDFYELTFNLLAEYGKRDGARKKSIAVLASSRS